MNDVTSIYKELRREVVANDLSQKMSPPLLLNPTPRWWSAQHRLLVVGQETQGWGFKVGEQKKHAGAHIKSWADFMASGQSVQQLMDFYTQFSFARHHPRNRNSPFWQAFRELAQSMGEKGDDTDSTVLWTNLFRSDYEGGSVLYAPHSERAQILSLSRQTLLDEVAALKPSAIVFFTGPRYDFAVSSAFEGVEYQAIDGFPVRALCALKHPSLPMPSWRSYHPGYLSRSNNWTVVSYLGDRLRSLFNR